MSASRRRHSVLAALALASVLGVALVLVRFRETGRHEYAFLLWNLVLAWIPLVLALFVYDAYRRRGLRLSLAPAAVGWLLFFPNAPYVVTDFVHLGDIHGMPLWYDAAMVASFALTSLVLGFVSLALLHAVAERMAGRAVAWGFVVVSLALCSVGIYLGRFLRFNSWTLLTRPGHLLELGVSRLREPLGNPLLLEVVAVSTICLAVGYLVVWALAQSTVELDRRRSSSQ